MTFFFPKNNRAHRHRRVAGHVQVHTSAFRFASRDEVGAVATFGSRRELVGYRPTLGGCFMRDVSRDCLCSVCRDLILRRLLDAAGGPLGGAPLERVSTRAGAVGLSAPRLLATAARLAPRVALRWSAASTTGAFVEDLAKRDLRHWRDAAAPRGCWELLVTAAFTALRPPLEIIEARARLALDANATCAPVETAVSWRARRADDARLFADALEATPRPTRAVFGRAEGLGRPLARPRLRHAEAQLAPIDAAPVADIKRACLAAAALIVAFPIFLVFAFLFPALCSFWKRV